MRLASLLLETIESIDAFQAGCKLCMADLPGSNSPVICRGSVAHTETHVL